MKSFMDRTFKIKGHYAIISSVLLFLFFFSCTDNPIESGNEAFQKQNYTEALRHYLEALKKNPDDASLKEKIALSYFKEGEIFFEKTRVIKAFEVRIRLGVRYLPEPLTPQMKSKVSDMYYQLARAYRTRKAENPYQKQKYFDKALENLEKSLTYDSTNVNSSKTLEQFKEEHFQNLLDKGLAAYRKGRSDPLQYIAADHYLTNALKLDPDNSTANKYLARTRKKALNLLDPGLDVPIAITDQMVNNEYMAFLVVIYNLLPDYLYVHPKQFVLVREDGKEIYGKTTGMFSTPLEAKSIGNGEETGGVVAFPLKERQEFARLEFRKDGEVLGYKNLP